MIVHIILIILDLIMILINTAVLAYGDPSKFTIIYGISSGLVANVVFSIGVLCSVFTIKNKCKHYGSKV